MISELFKELKKQIKSESALKKRLVNNLLWSFAGTSFFNLTALISSIIVARFLGSTIFGELGIINSTLLMFSVFAGLGLGLTSTKHIAEFRNTDPIKTGKIIGMSHVVSLISGIAIAASLFIFAPWLCDKTLNAPGLAGALRVSSFILVLNAFNGSLTGAITGFEAFNKTALINLVLGLLNLPAFVLGVKIWGLFGAIYAMLLLAFIGTVLNYILLMKIALKNNVIIRYSGLASEYSVLWKFSVPALLSSLLVMPVMWITQAFLVNKPGGYHEMGIFNAANQWRSLILFIPNIASQVILPVISNLYGEGDFRSYKKTLAANFALTALLAIVCWAAVAAFSYLIMGSYGKDFIGGRLTLIVLCFSAVFHVMGIVGGQVIVSTGKMWDSLLINTIWAAAMIVSAYYLSGMGSIGLAWSYLIAYFVLFITAAFYVSAHFNRLAQTKL